MVYEHDDTGYQRRDASSKPLHVQSLSKNITDSLERNNSWQWLGLGRNSTKSDASPTASIDQGLTEADGDAADTGTCAGACAQ
jgi:hypothetical protein